MSRFIPTAQAAIPQAPQAFCATLPEWKIWSIAVLANKDARPPELVLDGAVNGDPARTTIQAVCLKDARLGVLASDWRGLRLRPTTPVRLGDGRLVFPLESIEGVTYAVDPQAQSLDISAPPAAFDASRIQAADNSRTSPPPPPLGGYLTYDITSTLQNGRATGYGVGLEGVVFSRFGILDINGAVRAGGSDARLVRGAIYWERPLPDAMADVTVGDAIGGAGDWSRPVRFGGFRISRSFDSNPGFVTYPTPSLSGSAALPSVIDVMVNDQTRERLNVGAGPFQITNLPVLTGGGQVQLVVKDALGRETVITQPYYVAPRLLSRGLSDFDVYAGFLRQNFGEARDGYGKPVAAADYRVGVSDGLTVEGRLEAEPDRYAAGLGSLTRIGTWGALRADIAYAVGAGWRQGATYVLGFSSTWAAWGVNIAGQYYDPGYRPIAFTPGESRPRLQLSAGGGVQLRSAGSLTIGYMSRSSYDGASASFINAGWSRPLGRRVNIGVSLGGDLARRGWSAGLTLSMPLGRGVSASSRVNRDSDGAVSVSAEAGSGVPSGPGVGWRLRASDNPGQTLEGEAIYNAGFARLTADVAYGGDVAARLDATGSVGLIGGHAFLARPIQSSFALVRTGDVTGAAVMLWNQPVAITGRDGTALIPNLGAYQQNKISIDPAQIPLDVDIGATEVSARPWPRSGVVVDFPIRRSRSALIVLRLANGEAPPNGAQVTVSPGGTVARMAEGGEVWVTDLANDNRLRVQWEGHACEAGLSVPAKAAAGTRIGPILCVGR